MDKKDLQTITARLSSVLTDLGFEFHMEADNRPSHRSHYLYVRRPVYVEIRVSDHVPTRLSSKRKRIDVGPHATSLEDAIKEINTLAQEVP